MIRNTFSMLSGIGEKLERRLWRSGVLRWEDFLGSGPIDFIAPDRKSAFDQALSDASERLAAGDSRYFAGALRSREQWRLFDAFRHEAAYLDIETNGLAPGAGGHPTVVGIYDGFDYKAIVSGHGLNGWRLTREFSRYKLLVTFFGSAFDVPFLERTLPGFRLRVPHFDLCFGAKRLGLGGGLKKVEAALGIERCDAVKGMNGYDAVRLWIAARRGSEEAMDLLVAYNREDTVNLARVAAVVYDGLRAATGIEEYLNAAA